MLRLGHSTPAAAQRYLHTLEGRDREPLATPVIAPPVGVSGAQLQVAARLATPALATSPTPTVLPPSAVSFSLGQKTQDS
jgi:hypothetical protein